MGHNIHYREYTENVDKKAVQAWWDDYASKEAWKEGSSGLNGNIRWIDRICENRDKAEEFIRRNDSGWYDQLAVKFYDYPRVVPTKTLSNLRERLEKEEDKLVAYRDAHSIATFKADYVGCPECGSKLKKVLLKSNCCPLCGTDMRSKTTLDTLARYEKNIRELKKQIVEEEHKMQAKVRNKAVVKWLVKVEYHT